MTLRKSSFEEISEVPKTCSKMAVRLILVMGGVYHVEAPHLLCLHLPFLNLLVDVLLTDAFQLRVLAH